MGKAWLLGLGLPVAALATGAAGLSWHNMQQYQQQHQTGLAWLNQSLQASGWQVQCGYEYSMPLLQRIEQCALTDSAGQTLAGSWHQVTALPWQVSGRFGVQPDSGAAAIVFMTVPQLLADQQGSWRIRAGDQQATFRYRSGSVDHKLMPGTRLQLQPLEVQGQLAVQAPYRSELIVQLPSLLLTDASQGDLEVRGLSITLNSLLREQVSFTERLRYRLDSFSFHSRQLQLGFRDLQIEQANLVDGDVLASLSGVAVDTLRWSAGEHDLRVDPSGLQLYLDGFSWPLYRLFLQGDITPDVLLQSVAAKGMSLTLEDLHSSFVYQSREPAMLGSAGDLRASGKLTMAAGKADQVWQQWPQRLSGELTLNVSRSLMLGPQAELMLEFLNQGWLAPQDDRLQARLTLQQGQLLANGRAVTQLFNPPVYEEDH